VIRAIELTPDPSGALPPGAAALLALGPDLAFVSEPPGVDSSPAIAALAAESAVPLVPHLTTRNRTAHDVAERVGGWRGTGIERLLALRGDAVGTCDLARDQSLRSARELVQLLLALDPELEVWVAGHPEGHPEAHDLAADRHALTAKLAAGAAGVVCQFSLTVEPYLRLRDAVHALGHGVPLLAGVLPVHEARWFERFCASCGVAVPAPVRAALARYADDPASLAAFGAEHARGLVEALAGAEADGVVLFARGAPDATAAAWEALVAARS
jgi:methylenetetrahydrofolate reductase (NADPH)